MGKYEVTQAEYKSVMTGQTVKVGDNTCTLEAKPSYCSEGNTDYAVNFGSNQGRRPVENVTWYDAVYFCNAKSTKEGLTPAYNITVTCVDSSYKHITAADVSLVENANGYRLPTEAEWEYAGRGGDTSKADWDYLFSGAATASGVNYDNAKNSGIDKIGWYKYNNKTGETTNDYQTNTAEGKGPHQVGQKKANRLGLYDMSGNVFEWCYDRCSNWYNTEAISTESVTNPSGALSGPYRVAGGGSWYVTASYASVCNRYKNSPNDRYSYLGFRLVRSSF